MTNVYRPIDVLDQQMDFIRYWQRSAYASHYAETFQPFIDAVDTGTTKGSLTVRDYFANRADRAESIFVSEEIVSRLHAMTLEYETDVTSGILPQDLPCESGYVWLAKPVYMTDVRGNRASVRVIFWSTERNGILLSMFNDALDMHDTLSSSITQRMGWETAVQVGGRTPLFHIFPWHWGHRIVVGDLDKPPLMKDSKDPADLELWEQNHEKAGREQVRIVNFILALWEFMGQQLPWVAKPDRYLGKRLKRENSTISEVKVVDLRTVRQPYREPNENPEEIIWRYRWRVRPHPRRWIDKKTGEWRETTVKGYVKGPEHLPLIEKDTVVHVRR